MQESTPDRSRLLEVRAIFERALQQSAEARSSFVSKACGMDTDLLRDVQRLLSAHEKTSSLFDPVGPAAARDGESEPGPQVIGPYAIEGEIGRGGMGAVYRGRRADGTFDKKVALKLVRLDSASPELLRRFHRERQILAGLEHPYIARILDGGETPERLPYLVMEFIEGERIDVYAGRHSLGIRDRLRLFRDVCSAVQYAHQNLVVHRDLKPSNILVTADGTVKLLDFGIAKIMSDAEDGQMREPTLTVAEVMTPEYASPEQIAGRATTTASDVYSLGVILYRLLTGQSPYGDTTSWPALMFAVCVKEPPKPSSVVKAGGSLRGELDNIVMMALRKEVSRRYQSVEQLREDIDRYLDDRPVRAQGDSVAYRARKFIGRHRIGVGAAVLATASLVAGTAVALWQARRADREAASARAVSDFLKDDLLAQASANKQAKPAAKPDPDLKVRTALDRAAVRIAGKFDRQPEVEAAIRDTIGQTYIDLGLYPEAQKQLERALDLERRVLGAENPKTLKTICHLGRIAFLQGDDKQAETLYSQILAVQRRVLGPEHPDTLDTMNSLGNVYVSQSNYAKGEAMIGQTLEIRRRVLGSEHRDTLDSMNSLAVLYDSQGRYSQAQMLVGQAMEIMRRTLGSEHPETLLVMNNLAVLYSERGEYAQAEALLAQTVEIQRRVLGTEHPRTLETLDSLADVYYEQGKYAQAAKLLSQTLKIQRRVLGLQHSDTLDTMSSIESMYQRQGKHALAAAYARQVLAVQRQIFGPEDPATIESAANLALAYQSLGRFAESASLAREALEYYRKTQPDDWGRFRAESLLGASLAGQKKYAEAEALLLEGYQGMVARKDRIAVPDWYHLDRAREWIIHLYQAWGKPERTAEWRAELKTGVVPKAAK